MIISPNRFDPRRIGLVAILTMLGLRLIVSPAAAQKLSGEVQTGPSSWFRILIPADLVPSQIGRASFRLGSDMILVFSASLPVRRSALRGITGIPDAQVIQLPHATILKIPLPLGQTVHAEPAAESFHIVLGSPQHVEQATPSFINGQIIFPVTSAANTVAFAPSDHATPLLIGTVTGNEALGRMLRGPGYTTIPTSNGIVIAAVSDDLELAQRPDGFALRSDVHFADLPIGNPPVSAERVAEPAHSHGLDLPLGTVVALRHRMESAQRRVAYATPLNRVRASLRLARTLLSLGLGPEAHGVLTDMLRQDPEAIDDPQRHILLDIADILSHRPIVGPLNWPKRIDDQGQRDLWLGLSEAQRGMPVSAAVRLSRALPALLASPPLLRMQIMPSAVETLVAAGSLSAARTILEKEPDEGGLALARAELLQAEQHPHAAIIAYRTLITSPDQRVGGIAQFRSTMLQLHSHAINPKQAAESLERHLYDWRGTRHELSVRLAMAKLQAQNANWPKVFAGLQRADQLLPDRRADIFKVRQSLFNQMISSGALANLQPVAAVSILQSNPDLILPGGPGIPALEALWKSLVALDLSDQAIPVLQQLIERAPDDERRARFGYALAKLDLDGGLLKQARSALTATDAADIGRDLGASRSHLADEIAAKTGSDAEMVPLTKLDDPHALTVAAQVAERHHNWPLVEQTAEKLASITVANNGPLDRVAAGTIEQWAVAASHTNDKATLAQLRHKYGSRMPRGRDAELFETLTAPTLTSQSSLSAAVAQIEAIERVGNAVGPDKRAATEK